MKLERVKIICVLFLFFISFISGISQSIQNRNNLFDNGWRFHRGGSQGAENPAFDDSPWQLLNLPHDWSIEDLPGTNSPFHSDAISQVSGGFTTGGTGWYRKTFKVPGELRDKHFVLMFEGVYMNAEVWLNGVSLGKHQYGYTSFWFDISGKIKFDKENVLAVKVENEGENSRWYSGSGIYRHVWLNVSAPIHISTWGINITTPQVTEKAALIDLKTSIENKSPKASNIKLVTKIVDANLKEKETIETTKIIEPGTTFEIEQRTNLNNPSLWSPDLPVLYTAFSEIYESDSLLNRVETKFGIRSLSFDVATGFSLNGKPFKLKGGCVHHDNGPLGAKAFDRAEERRVEILKANGYNAVRTAHNPPSPAFLDACDRVGMMVIDESFDMWTEQKNPFDYHLYFNDWWKKDIESMILRDRNHPSVIIWSIGNEIPNRQKTEVVAVAKMVGDYLRLIDHTRPVTSAVNNFRLDQDPFFATLDLAGYNYASRGNNGQNNTYETDHKRVPERTIVNLESFPMEAFNSWMDVLDHPYVIGDFVWTAFDYIGEASIGWRGYPQSRDFYPWNLAFCGDIDICGWKRPRSYYRDVLWAKNKLSIWVTSPQPSFPLMSSSKWNWTDVVDNWNWESNGKAMEVNVYSSCQQVELFLNGKSLGKKPTNRATKFIATWQVSYEPGTLKAVGTDGNKQVNIYELNTAGEPKLMKLSADRNKIQANGQDLSYITVDLTDDKGIFNTRAENLISFEVVGPGTIVGVGNANPISIESYQLPQRKAWHGRCLVIIKSDTIGGKIILKSTSSGLNTASIEIESH